MTKSKGWDETDIESVVNRKRRQIHVHSTLYYHLHENLISDAQFDKISNELVAMHIRYPELKHQGYASTLFADWTGDTGMHLPVTEYTYGAAVWLLERARLIGHTITPTNSSRAPEAKNEWEQDVAFKK